MPNNFQYTPNVPNPPNNPSVDVPSMQTNAQSISSLISIDHVGFNTIGSGIHQQVTLVNQSAPGLGDGKGVLYANNSFENSWPFWQNTLGSFQLLGPFSTLITPTAASPGLTYLPGGIIMQWGSFTAVSQTLTFKSFTGLGGIAFPNNCFIVLSNINEVATINSIVLNISDVTNLGFDYYNTSSSPRTFFWYAIGN